ncbi:MAG: hypothetical protein JWO83_672 [Caulobacteraceae bacterium]|nr:hypothetical protein [Caulobacteraceae bacterium]
MSTERAPFRQDPAARSRVFGLIPLSRFYQGRRATPLGRRFSHFWAAWSARGLPSFHMVQLELRHRRPASSCGWPWFRSGMRANNTWSPCSANARGCGRRGRTRRRPSPSSIVSGSGWRRSRFPSEPRSSRRSFAVRRAADRTSVWAPERRSRTARRSLRDIRCSGSSPTARGGPRQNSERGRRCCHSALIIGLCDEGRPILLTGAVSASAAAS